MPQETKRLLIQGRVQGVGYRYFFHTTAQDLGLSGWVRNRRDGSVEAVIQGDARAVRDMIERASRGPGMAHVDNVEESFVSGEFAAFEIRDTQ